MGWKGHLIFYKEKYYSQQEYAKLLMEERDLKTYHADFGGRQLPIIPPRPMKKWKQDSEYFIFELPSLQPILEDVVIWLPRITEYRGA